MSDVTSGPTSQLPLASPKPKPRPSPGRRSAPAPGLGEHTQEIPTLRRPELQPAWQGGRPPRGFFQRLGDRLAALPPWAAPAAVVLGFLGAAALVLATDPTDDVGPTTCAFKWITGFDCPGCGGTRAFYYVLTMNLPEAARHHVIAVFAAPFLVYLFAVWTLRRTAPTWKLTQKIPRLQLSSSTLVWFLVAWGAFWVARNLPFAPFTALYV